MYPEAYLSTSWNRDTSYGNYISPGVDPNDDNIFCAYCTLDSGYVSYGLVTPISYGKHSALRTSTTSATAVRTMLSRMVMSTSFGVSRIPTGKVYSPDRRYADNGYFCNQYGYIAYDDYGVTYSYGHFSILLI